MSAVMKENKTLHSYHNRMSFSSLSPTVLPLESRILPGISYPLLLLFLLQFHNKGNKFDSEERSWDSPSDKPGYTGETQLLCVYYKTFRQ